MSAWTLFSDRRHCGMLLFILLLVLALWCTMLRASTRLPCACNQRSYCCKLRRERLICDSSGNDSPVRACLALSTGMFCHCKLRLPNTLMNTLRRRKWDKGQQTRKLWPLTAGNLSTNCIPSTLPYLNLSMLIGTPLVSHTILGCSVMQWSTGLIEKQLVFCGGGSKIYWKHCTNVACMKMT